MVPPPGGWSGLALLDAGRAGAQAQEAARGGVLRPAAAAVHRLGGLGEDLQAAGGIIIQTAFSIFHS